MCVQRKANKIVPTEDDMIRANINSFGDDIGKITNRITSMFNVQARFPKGSKEHEVLSYRIECGQLFQQNYSFASSSLVQGCARKTPH